MRKILVKSGSTVMDRSFTSLLPLSRELSSIGRGIDRLIEQNSSHSLLAFITSIYLGLLLWTLTTANAQRAAYLIDTKDWSEIGDCRFRLFANGRGQLITQNGLKAVRSKAQLERLVRKHLKSQGLLLDSNEFRNFMDKKRTISATSLPPTA